MYLLISHNFLRSRKGCMFILLATIFVQLESVQWYRMNPKRKELIEEMIRTMKIRKLGTALNTAGIEAYQTIVEAKYFWSPTFEDSLYRKFVLAFEAHVKPKLTLKHGDSCDPSYTNQYKYPENLLIRDESLQHWVGLHIPNKTTGQAEISSTTKYCNFRRGLICSPTSSKCECPPGATYMDADDPFRFQDKYCFIQPNNKCDLLDLTNDDKTEGNLLERLPYLIFNPERPVSCSPGTWCRFKQPFVRVPRCWCVDQSTPSCADAKIYWPWPSFSRLIVPPDSISLPSLLESLSHASSNFELRYKAEDTPDNGPINGAAAPPELIDQYKTLRSIDEVGVTVDIAALQAMKTALDSSAATHCWVDLFPDYDCEVKRDSSEYYDYENDQWQLVTNKYYCNCELKPDSDYAEIHLETYLRYGSPCQFGNSGCLPEHTCQRWDKTSSEGICYCPDGYGWVGYCDRLSEFPQAKTSLVNFIHPTTVAVRGKDLRDIQKAIELYEEDTIWTDGECPLQKEQERQEAYRFFTSLQERTAGSSGVDRAALEVHLRTLEEAYNAEDNFCNRKHGFVCVSDPNSANPNDGVCKEATTPVPDVELIEKNPLIKMWNERVSDFYAYKEKAAEYLLDNVDIVKEVDCVVAPTPSGRSANVDVNEEGECLEGNICMEDYSSPFVFSGRWDVTRADGSKATVFVNNGEVPPQNSGDVSVLTECQPGRDPAKTMCQCLNDGGRTVGRSGRTDGFAPCDVVRSSYKNCEKFVLEEKAKVVRNLIITKSTLNEGEACDHKAENYVKAGITSEDLYQILGNLKMALKRQTQFCDRRKLLVCGSDNKCGCQAGTDFRRTNDGKLSEHCYLKQGSCKQDVTTLIQMFPAEKVEVQAHYGDPMDTARLDMAGCMKNLCVLVETSSSTCVPNDKFTVLQPPGSPEGYRPGNDLYDDEDIDSGSVRVIGKFGKILVFGVALLTGKI